MAKIDGVVPNAQLGMINIAGSQTPVVSPYDLTQKRQAAALNMALAKNQDMRAQSQLALNQNQDARAQSQLALSQNADVRQATKLNDQQRQDFLNEAAVIYGEATKSGADEAAVRGMLAQKLNASIADPEERQRGMQMLQDPSGWQALQNELKGRYVNSQKASGYQSTSAKDNQTWVNPVTGETKKTAVIGGQLYDTIRNTPITDSEELKGFNQIDTVESGDKKGFQEAMKMASETAKGIRESATNVRTRLKPNLIALRAAANKADFGTGANQRLALKRFGSTLNDLFGKDIIPVDDESIASGELINAIQPDLALELTARTKGAISDTEMAMFLSAVPGLTQSKGGFLKLVEMMEALSDRVLEVDQFVTKQQRASGGKVPYDIEDRIRNRFEGESVFTKKQLEMFGAPKGYTINGQQLNQGDTFEFNGQSYKIVGGDPNDPDVELVP